jgi:hypothetical protein
MENIKKLVQWHVDEADYARILCAQVSYRGEDYEDVFISLQIDGDVSEFLDKLDFEKEKHNIKATIWWKNGAWSEYEPGYDYCYWDWVCYKLPEIPELCR